MKFSLVISFLLASFCVLLQSCDQPNEVDANRERSLNDVYEQFPTQTVTAELNYICDFGQGIPFTLEMQLEPQTLNNFAIEELRAFHPQFQASISAKSAPLMFDEDNKLRINCTVKLDGLVISDRNAIPISLIINDRYRQDILIDMAPDTILVERDRGRMDEVEVGTTSFVLIPTWNICVEDWELDFFELDDPTGTLELHNFRPDVKVAAGEQWDLFLEFSPREAGEHVAYITMDFKTNFRSTIRFFYEVTVIAG